VKLDPSNKQASDRLAEIESEQSGSSGTETPSTTQPSNPKPTTPAPTPDAFLQPVKDLKALLPKSVPGYAMGTATGNKTDVAVSGSPTDPEALASRCVWTVHDRGKPSEAKAFVEDVSKELYASDAAAPTIDGVPAYFGTDGTRFATVVYVRGRYVFEVVLTKLDGSPEQLQGEAEAAAKAFPDKP
jgi:hypothetical protein